MGQIHDIGGLPSSEPINKAEYQLMDWELEVEAVTSLLGKKKVRGSDEFRRAIEEMPPEEYRSAAYYERWAASLETLMIEKGIVTKEQIDRKAAEVEARRRT